MSTQIFAIGNQKGGVGKTTTAINLAVGLARQKIPTLLVDLDPQSNATSGLGYEKSPGSSLYLPLLGEHKASTKIIHTQQKYLSLIPGELDLAALETELQQKENYLLQLKQCLHPIINSQAYKAIILDCPPAIGMLSMNALAAATHLIIALQCEYLALEGLSQILNTQQEIQSSLNPNLKFGGIVMTMYDVRTRLSNQVVNEVKEHLSNKMFKALIPRSIRLAEAPSHGKSIFAHDPTSSGALAYQKLAKEFIHRFNLK